MACWSKVKEEIINLQNSNPKINPHDVIRRKYLKIMSEYTDRNVIAYYSGFLQKPLAPNISIDDIDKNAFMQTIYGLDNVK